MLGRSSNFLSISINSYFKNNFFEWTKYLSRERHLPASIIWIQPTEATWWDGRAESCRLSSDLLVSHSTHVPRPPPQQWWSKLTLIALWRLRQLDGHEFKGSIAKTRLQNGPVSKTNKKKNKNKTFKIINCFFKKGFNFDLVWDFYANISLSVLMWTTIKLILCSEFK